MRFLLTRNIQSFLNSSQSWSKGVFTKNATGLVAHQVHENHLSKGNLLRMTPNMRLTIRPKVDHFPSSSAPDFVAADSCRAENRKSRKLVVLLSWLMAKESHLNKFRAFYINHGFDVLTVKVNPLEVMLPSIGAQKAGHHLIDYLRDNVQKYPQIVVHGFSVGSYLFGEMLVALESRGHDKNQIKRHIKGLIFDSSIDMESVPHGYPRAILGDNIVTQMTEPIITTYLTVAYPIATRHYQASFRSLRQLDIKCPALLLYSQRDRVGSPQVNQRLITAWKSNGIPVYYKCWSDSLHVSHYYKYPEEYRQELNKFLETINL